MDASRTLKNRRGIAVVYLALLLIVLVGFAALTIDVGYFYVVKGQLQNAADAAALAGAAGLDGKMSYNQMTARTNARDFAQKNSAEGSPVMLDLNDSNTVTGDIVIGCWKNNAMDTTCSRPNSVRVNARRSNDAGIGPTPVGTFFGKVLGFNTVNIGAIAIAQRPAKPTVPLAHCLPICQNSYSFPAIFHLKPATNNSGYTDEEVMGWTEFSSTDNAVDLGPGTNPQDDSKTGVVARLLRGERDIPDNICNTQVYTNTGIGSIRPIIQAEYDNKNVNGNWKVIIPIFDVCAAVDQSSEKLNNLSQYAEAVVSNVDMSSASDPTITISSVNCMPCSTATFISDTAKLVK